MTTIYFTKQFTSGNLKGLSYATSISFDDKRTAEMSRKLAIGTRGKDCLTHDCWIVTDASFQNYVRRAQ